MNAPAPTAPAASDLAAPGISVVELDRSCRFPVLFLFASAAVWLVIGTLVGTIASIQMHTPSFLAGVEWLTFGRTHPAALNSLLYGFAIQIGLGFFVWLTSRLAKARARGPAFMVMGGAVWNLGVMMGVLAILAGGSTGFYWLEMPLCSGPILFASYIVIALFVFLTFCSRSESEPYVSQWYVMGALFWFPWVFAAAELLLLVAPLRGVMQFVTNEWYIQNLLWVWLTLGGVAALYYFAAKLLGRPLHSYYLALFGFWALVFVTSCGGIPVGSPVPKWIPSVSVGLTMVSLVPLAAVAINLALTAGGQRPRIGNPFIYKFIVCSALAFVVAGLLHIAGAFRSVAALTELTFYRSGTEYLQLLGFFGMALAGAAYYAGDRVSGLSLLSLKTIQAQFWLMAVGVILTAIPLVIGGAIQGSGIHRADTPFPDVARSTVPFIGMSTLGWLLLFLSSLLFAANMFRFCTAFCCGRPEEIPPAPAPRKP